MNVDITEIANLVEAVDLTDCDREPIHVPGSIQPHGIMLVADRDTLSVSHAAGDVEGRLGVADWLGRSLAEVVTDPIAARIARIAESSGSGGFAGQLTAPSGEVFDVSANASGEHVIVEIEPGPGQAAPASAVLGALESAGAAFERAANLKLLCERAAMEFRRITGFDRVMVYRFLDDDAGTVLAEDRDPSLPSFLNHHFPGSDIPKQARALYVRNLVRVIPDIHYEPAPLRPAWAGEEPLDMSDSALRSVSPVHLQYMRNMDVGASASISIVKDGLLWGLIACHHAAPRLLPYDVRVACRVLAGGLSRQIRAKEEAESYRERIRLRGFEDEVIGLLEGAPSLDEGLHEGLPSLLKMLDADGVVVVRGGSVFHTGVCPPESAVRELVAWLLTKGPEPVVTDRLPEIYPPAAQYAEHAGGLLAVTVSTEEPLLMMWFRAEQVQVVNWAGNPHKDVAADGRSLTPRASFEAWSEAVRGRARPWPLPAVEAATRLRRLLLDARQIRRMRELNHRLTETVADKESLLQQKELLLREVNHRVQNSLQLVSSFLGLQARASDNDRLKDSFEEARRRLAAVALVHRRLYRADQIETIDLSRYIEDLAGEMLESMGPEWAGQITLDTAPILVPTDRAVTLGLVLTELVINANKYAYGGAPGPIAIILQQQGSKFRLVVADEGGGKHQPGQGFGTRMMTAMVGQLSGELQYLDNGPGVRAVLTAPIGAGPAGA